MITSTFKEPFSGWIEGGLRTIDGPLVCYGKGKLECLLANPNTILDLIPADMVINLTMMAMLVNGNGYDYDKSSQIIYHVCSSMRNPLRILNLHEFSSLYFSNSPFIDKDGKPIKVSNVTILDSTARFHRYMTIRYLLPLKGLKLINLVFCQCFNNVCLDLDRKIKVVMQLVELYRPYMFFNGVFDDTNSKKLHQKMMDNEMEGPEIDAFNFDPEGIDWEDYIINTHIPSLLRHVLKR
ncbi:Fatty acyl-CoA reductase [Melia azedarach]|uniref:Fatty acyl-CoA reductase n=1 Tax=Melia azedarach TaxID=155640 RepID=A0ACC1YMM2_MELAZ|nr:Fatty acyl-CoA reductase [Melia azedarach]